MSVLAAASSEKITGEDKLIGYFAGAEKPREKWLIGCEHEKFPFRLSDRKPVSYDGGIGDLLQALRAFGWQPVMEGATLIGLTRDKSTISLEPGGQFELGGGPFPNMHEVDAEFLQHLKDAGGGAEKLGFGFLGMGFHPTATRADITLMPKDRYRIQEKNMPKYGSMALDMMKRTCTVQVNLDYAGETDMIKKFRVSLALQPLATALFATSPFYEGKPSGYVSYRMHVWEDVDNARSGAPEFVYESGFGYERYMDYALDVPMQFVYRDGHHIDCYGQSFRDFMKGRLPALPGELPTVSDWGNHLTTLFPDVRLKKILEMRGADAGPGGMISALPAFWTGILYDDNSLDAAWDLAKGWTPEDRARLHCDTPRLGLQAEIRGRKLADIARDVLRISENGLRKRARLSAQGKDETVFLAPLRSIVERGQSLAEQWLAEGRDAKTLFEIARLRPPSL